MKTTTLTESRPPEFYNQESWLCLKQRNAWLLQRWLEQGDAFYYFLEKNTPVFISDEIEIESLFHDECDYAVRYVEETYWIALKNKGFYFVLNPHQFVANTTNNERFFPQASDIHTLNSIKSAVQSVLSKLYKHQEIPDSLKKYDVTLKEHFSNGQAIWSEIDESECVNFYTNRKHYSLSMKTLLEWHQAIGN